LYKNKKMQATISLKDMAVEAIRQLPDTASAEEMMYQISLVENVIEGLKDVEAGRTFTTDEVLQKIKQWQK